MTELASFLLPIGVALRLAFLPLGGSLPRQIRLQTCVQVYSARCAKISKPSFEGECTHQWCRGDLFATSGLLQNSKKAFRIHNSERTAHQVLCHLNQTRPVP